MLILTRRPQESIRLGQRIRIIVLGFKGNQVRIGIEAPAEITIDREEVWERKQQERLGSMTTLHEKARIP
jgi:carbon storage regulator